MKHLNKVVFRYDSEKLFEKWTRPKINFSNPLVVNFSVRIRPHRNLTLFEIIQLATDEQANNVIIEGTALWMNLGDLQNSYLCV